MLVFASCETSITRTNDAEDMNLAKESAAGFYNLVQQEQFDQAASLFTPSISFSEGFKLLGAIKGMRGRIVDAITDKIGTKVTTINGNLSHIQFSLELDCVYELGKTRETLVFEGNSFDSLLISGYHFEMR